MGTRGLYGFRKNGVDKTTYNHFDSYPDWLGRNVVRFCIETTEEEMNRIYDGIELIDENSKPTIEQVMFCVNNGLYDDVVSSRNTQDWYCLLRNIQGDLDSLKKLIAKEGKAFMIDNHTFILDSLWCEYAYIINLDTHMMEFYVGFQKEPQEGNRYGCVDNRCYYPCKLVFELPLCEIKNEDVVVEKMRILEETE